MNTASQLGDDMARLVSETARRLRQHGLITGFCTLLFTTIGWLTIASTIDMFMPLDVPMRVVMWSALWAGALTSFFAGVVWPLFRPLPTTVIAHRIENTLPDMNNRLITVLDLRRRNGTSRYSPQFVERLLNQTREHMRAYKIRHVADPRLQRRSVIVASAVILVAATLLVVFHRRLPTAMARVCMPTASIAPASWVTITAVPGDAHLLQGEPLRIEARLTTGRADQLEIELHTRGETWERFPMEVDEHGVFFFEDESVDVGYDYRILATSTWTPVYRITMIRRPIMTDLVGELLLPQYMALPEPRPIDMQATQISCPTGATIRVRATVEGDVTTDADAEAARIIIYHTAQQSTEEISERQIVWFDDKLPDDAVSAEPWQWMEMGRQVFSGTRAHTFGWDRLPYGFTTRLNRLEIQPGASFFVYAWLDADEPPGRVVVAIDSEQKRYRMVWGDPLPESEQQKSAAEQLHAVHVGQLPVTGKWVRLEVPLDQVLGRAGEEPVAFDGVSFEIDKGRVLFDRAGKVLRQKKTISTSKPEQTQTIAMRFVPDETGTDDTSVDRAAADGEVDTPGVWTADIPIDVECLFAIEFRDALGQTNALTKPMPVIVTDDLPPTVFIEKPGRSITIMESEPVPLVIRALDDYGVQRVGLRIGSSPDTLSEPTWIAEFARPQTNRLVMDVIDPAAQSLSPGESLYYSVRVRDRAGQTAESEPLRLGLASPEQASTSQGDQDGPTIDLLLQGINELLTAQGDIAASAMALLASMPETALPVIDHTGQVVELTNPDGSPITDDQWRKVFERYESNLTDTQRAQFTDLNNQIAAKREELRAMAQTMHDAATRSFESPISVPIEAESLAAAARRAYDASTQFDQWQTQDQNILKRLLTLRSLTAGQQQEMQSLMSHLRQLQAVQQSMQTRPQTYQRKMSTLVAQMRAREQVEHLETLDDVLDSQRRRLENLRHQVEQLQQRAEDAPGDELEEISKQQEELDPELIEAIKQAQALALQRLRDQANASDTVQTVPTPPAPWRPPGRTFDAMPVEQDTPETEPNDSKPADAKPSSSDEPDGEKDGPADYWDRPIALPDAPLGSRIDPRFGNRNRGVDRPIGQHRRAARTSRRQSPREMLSAHMNQLHQDLTQNSNDVEHARSQVDAALESMHPVAQELANLYDQTEQSGEPPSQQKIDDAVDQLADAMAGQKMQELQQTSQRAGSLMLFQSLESSSQGGPGNADAFRSRPGRFMSVDLTGVSVGRALAPGVYRLPPRLRRPLLHGITERGPKAYQPMIDEYYRLLSKEVE